MGQLQKPRAYQESFRGSFVVLWEKRTSESSPTRGAASDMVARVSMLRLSFFFFFLGFMPTRLRLVPNRVNSARIKLYRLHRVVSTSNQNGLESCQNGQNQLWMRPKHPKFVLPQFYSEYLLLLLCFLFCFVFCCVSYLLLSLFCESRS